MSTNFKKTAAAKGSAAEAVFVRIATVTLITGLGRSTIYRLVAQDKFPPPVKLTKKAVAWRRADLEVWGQGRSAATP
jgi:prophage regulatory protein